MGPTTSPTDSDQFTAWLAALQTRHLQSLTRSELTRALRALSSCYVERRDRLRSGGALDGTGKRAAFALFYAPLHFLTIRRIVQALDVRSQRLESLLDLGCGTGAGGGAWALECDRTPVVTGIDLHPWAVQEAQWTYRHFNLRGRALVGDVTTSTARARRASGIVLAYTVNELSPDKRAFLLDRLVSQSRQGVSVLIVEPIARRVAGWWTEWATAFDGAGARVDEWRFEVDLPPLLREIAGSAGLNPRELTARTIFTSLHRP